MSTEWALEHDPATLVCGKLGRVDWRRLLCTSIEMRTCALSIESAVAAISETSWRRFSRLYPPRTRVLLRATTDRFSADGDGGEPDELVRRLEQRGLKFWGLDEVSPGFSTRLTHWPHTMVYLRLHPTSNVSIDSLPPSVMWIFTGDNFSADLSRLPSKLRGLELGNGFDEELPTNLPMGLLVVRIGDKFNRPVHQLPASVQQLRLGWRFDQEIPELPRHLRVLEITSFCFNRSISSLSTTCPNLRELKLIGPHFNESIDHLPDTLQVLFLGDGFDRPLHKLPSKLRVLKIGNTFDQGIVQLPENLQTLAIGNRFNSWIAPFPPGLLRVSLGHGFDRRLPAFFQNSSLQMLSIGNRYNQPLPKKLPLSLRDLRIGHAFNHAVTPSLPAGIETLMLGRAFRRSLRRPPTGIETIVVMGDFDSSVDHFPHSVRRLVLGTEFSRRIMRLPRRLEVLDLSRCDKFNGSLSPGVTALRKLRVLKLGDAFDQPVDHLPDTLETFVVGRLFNQPVDCLPSGVTTIVLGHGFDHPVDSLPRSLQYLTLSCLFTRCTQGLPRSIRQLRRLPTS